MFSRIGLFVLITVLVCWFGRSSALELSSLSSYGVDSTMSVPQLCSTLDEQGFVCREALLPGSDDSRQLVFTRGDTQLSVLTYGEQVLEIFTPEVTAQGKRLHLGMPRQALVAQLGLPNAVERADEVELLYYRGSGGEFGVQIRQGKVDLFRLSPAPTQTLQALGHGHDSSEDMSRSVVGMCILGLSLLGMSHMVGFARRRKLA